MRELFEIIINNKLQLILLIAVILAYILLSRLLKWIIQTGNERGFSWWNGNEMIPPPGGNRVEVIQSDTTKHNASRMFVEEFTRSLKFVSSIRASSDDGFYSWLIAEVEELRAMSYPLKRLTLNLCKVEYMNTLAINSFSKIILDVKFKNGILLEVILPKQGEIMEANYINLMRLAEGEESVMVKTSDD